MPTSRPLTKLRLAHYAPRQCVCYRGHSPWLLRPLSTDTARSSPANPKTSRFRLKHLWYLLSLGIGVGAGLALNGYAFSRLYSPLPGSEADLISLEALADQMDKLEIVKHLRAQGYQSLSDIPQEAGKPKEGWLELDTQADIQDIVKGNTKTRALTEQSMAGIQGLGVQRAFWNSETRELVAAVWVGPRLSGWPGIAHGGAIATIFEEAMYRMIAGPNVAIDSIPTPTSMSLTYARPTPSHNVYILRTSFSTPDLPQDEPPAEPAPAKSWLPSWKDFTKQSASTAPQPPLEISGTLESLDGEVKVRAKGTWPASSIVPGNV